MQRSQVESLGTEILRTAELDGSSSLQTSRNADAQGELSKAFGGQFANRIDQTIEGGLDGNVSSSFYSDQQNSTAALAGTQRANAVGNAAVVYRQLYTQEIDIIKNTASTFAQELSKKENRDVSTDEATRRLAQELLRNVDKDWNTTLTKEGQSTDTEALNFLAENLVTEGGLYNTHSESELPVFGNEPEKTYTAEQIKDALQNYSVDRSDSYNNALQSADSFGVIGNIPIVSSEKLDFYRKYVSISSGDFTEEASAGRAGHRQGSLDALSGAVDGAQALFTSLIEKPEDTLTAISHGVIKPLVAPDQVAEELWDKYDTRTQLATIARLHGDEFEARRIEAATDLEINMLLVSMATPARGVNAAVRSVDSVPEGNVSTNTSGTRNITQGEADDFYNGVTQGNTGRLVDYKQLSTQTNVSPEVLENVIKAPKGQRPAPSTYLSTNQIDDHLSAFDGGVTKFVTKTNYNKYGIAQSDGTSFVLPKSEADALIKSTNGNPRALENALGLPENFLDSNTLMRVDVAKPKELNVRVPSGNEAGANDLWLPGGKLPNGNREAVIDAKNIKPENLSVNDLVFEK